jgi:hypothetical protein
MNENKLKVEREIKAAISWVFGGMLSEIAQDLTMETFNLSLKWSIKRFFLVSSLDSRSALPRLPRRLLSENLQICRVAVQRLGHSLPRRTFALQAAVAGALEEELC